MATLRELKSRIGSVSSTEKTTSAMKMISSAKMRKATTQLQQLTPYRGMVQQVLGHLLMTDHEFDSPLTTEREVKHIDLVIFGSDDGLCGAYNINLFKQLLTVVNDLRKGKQPLDITIIPVGKKLTRAALKLKIEGVDVLSDHGLDTRSNSEVLNAFTEMLRNRFVSGTTDRVDVLYMRFISTSRQRFTREQLLPVSPAALSQEADRKAANRPCLFEPDANTLFNSVLPLHIRATIANVYTQNSASEQSARVMAMQTASDNAKELLDDLKLEYNKLRQQSITTELLDILGGQVER